MREIDYILKAKRVLADRQSLLPGFSSYLDIQVQLDYIESVVLGEEKDKRNLHNLTLGIYAGKEFEQSDPELAECLSDVNFIASQIARGLKVKLP